MEKYILKKTKVRGTNLYTVVNEQGVVISTTKDKRDFVACTIKGHYFFGRKDLIGKGEHGKQLKYWKAVLANPEQAYESFIRGYYKGVREKIRKDYYYEKWLEESTKRAPELVEVFGTIAYLEE